MPWRLLKHGESLQVGDKYQGLLTKDWKIIDRNTFSLWTNLGHSGIFDDNNDQPIRRYYRKQEGVEV